ncbi:MAG: aminodeoxychorismate/anthranilate synthase component II [Bacteroidales bacterium]|nr:aminodeoxychorismate/anthranilate synthase component II [Bacteroidales bacterium]
MKMKKILVIDNYDSFTYNLVHYIESITGICPSVYRNDVITLEEVDSYDKILLSPGPGVPVDAGICIDLIKKYAPSKSILGICLGHQAICEAFDGKIRNMSNVYHGIATPVKISDINEPLFRDIPVSITVGRYHSWAVTEEDLPACLAVTCYDENGMIMGISHKEYDVRGLQFHPESILTEKGIDIIRNWIAVC